MNSEPKKKSYEWILSEKKVLLKAEIKRLRKFCKRLRREGIKKEKFFLVRDWFMVELGLFSGLRVEEMTDLKIKDMSITDRHASIFVRNGKGGKKRTVWINNKLKRTCNKFLKLRERFRLDNGSEQFLLTSNKGKRLTTRALQKQFKRCIEFANLPSHYSIHCLRHTYGTYLLKASRNLKLVMKQLGHSTIKTTEIYIGLIEKDTKHALKMLYRN